jgi:hypothetical protein
MARSLLDASIMIHSFSRPFIIAVQLPISSLVEEWFLFTLYPSFTDTVLTHLLICRSKEWIRLDYARNFVVTQVPKALDEYRTMGVAA